MTTHLPSKQILTSILTSLQAIPVPTTQDSSHQHQTQPHTSLLKTIPAADQQKAKSTLLTLHFLFPHELLPALDLIDRQLLTHLYTTPPPTPPSPYGSNQVNEVYYVQSASSSPTTTNVGSSRKGRFRNALSKPGHFYEVRLDSWNCSCPAFAYSGLRLMMREVSNEGGGRAGSGDEEATAQKERDWLVGGVTTKEDALIPICKHILAVTLARAAPALFGGGVMSRETSREEMAGWAAGWGEHG